LPNFDKSRDLKGNCTFTNSVQIDVKCSIETYLSTNKHFFIFRIVWNVGRNVKEYEIFGSGM